MNALIVNCSPVRDGATAEIAGIIARQLSERFAVRSICIDDYSFAFCLHHTARLMAGVFLQSVVLHRVIEDRDKLILYRPQVSLRIRLSICISILGQRVLRLTDIRTTLQNAY